MGEEKTLRVVWTAERVLEALREVADGPTNMWQLCDLAFSGREAEVAFASWNLAVGGGERYWVNPQELLSVADDELEAMAEALNVAGAPAQTDQCSTCGARSERVGEPFVCLGCQDRAKAEAMATALNGHKAPKVDMARDRTSCVQPRCVGSLLRLGAREPFFCSECGVIVGIDLATTTKPAQKSAMADPYQAAIVRRLDAAVNKAVFGSWDTRPSPSLSDAIESASQTLKTSQRKAAQLAEDIARLEAALADARAPS